MAAYEYVRYAPGPAADAGIAFYWSFGPLEECGAPLPSFAPVVDRVRVEPMPNPMMDNLLPKADAGLVFTKRDSETDVTGIVTRLGVNTFRGIDRSFGVKLKPTRARAAA